MWFKQLASSNQLSFNTGNHKNILGNAVFSRDGARRYFLEKRWELGGNILTAIMMNPSRAAHDCSDDTVDQIIDVAKDIGCHALYVVNVSSIIEGSSENLKSTHFAYEAINWDFIFQAMSEAQFVFLSWGLDGHRYGVLKHRKSNPNLIKVFKNLSHKLYCYEVVKSNDKKYRVKPLYYVPHPRPRRDIRKYRYAPIRQLTEKEFMRLFFR